MLAVTLSKNNETVERTVNDWIHITEQNNMKRLITDMAEKMYSDIYVKRYKPFMSLLAVLQKPKNVPRFIALAKACLSCKAYDELDKIQCPVFVIGGMQDKVVSGEASLEIAKKLGCEIFMYDDLGHAAYEEAKDFNQRVYNFYSISNFYKAKLPGCRIVKAEPYARCRRKTPLGLRAKRLSRSRVQPLPS